MHGPVDTILARKIAPIDGISETRQAFMDVVPVLRVGNQKSKFKHGTERVWPGLARDVKKHRAEIFKKKRSAFSQQFGQAGYVIAATTMGIATDSYYNDKLHSSERAV